MAHTFRVLQNRLQRLVIRDVPKYLYSISIVRLVDDVILRSKSNCTRGLRAVTLFLGWLIFPWKRRQGMDNPARSGQHQETPQQSRLIRVRKPTTGPSVCPKLLTTCFQPIYPNDWTWFEARCWRCYTTVTWSAECVSWIMSKVPLPLLTTSSYSSPSWLSPTNHDPQPTVEPN